MKNRKKTGNRTFIIATIFSIICIVLLIFWKNIVNLTYQFSLPNNFQLINNFINDQNSEFIIGQGNNLYLIKLDGTRPKILFTSNNPILGVESLNNNNLLVTTQLTDVKLYILPNAKSWILDKNNNFTQLSENLFTQISPRFATQITQYYRDHEPININQSIILKRTILRDNLDGKSPQVIGTISSKYSDLSFWPSFDGSYLLNNTHGGGKPPMPILAYVYATDTGKVIGIKSEDFDWYGGQAIWVDNNKILTSSNKIIEFIDDRYSVKHLDVNLMNYYQNDLSPSRELLVHSSKNKLSLFSFDKENTDDLVKLDNNKTIQKIGWNISSSKYAYFVSDNKDENIYFYIYDLKLKANILVLRIKPIEDKTRTIRLSQTFR